MPGEFSSPEQIRFSGSPQADTASGVALMRGCDIDKPRNLAKSVTVE